MFAGDNRGVTRRAALEAMKRQRGAHAFYGLEYDNVIELAEDEAEIRVYRDDESFNRAIDEVRKQYEEYGISPKFLCVHKF